MSAAVRCGKGVVRDNNVGVIGLELLVDSISPESVSSQESSCHRLVAVLSWIVVVIINGPLLRESNSEK